MGDFTGHEGAALVVGGSGGLGLAITRLLAKQGSHVAVTYRSRPEAGAAAVEAAREWGVHASAYPLDLGAAVTDAADVVGQVVADHGGLHTLVYAAGPHVPMAHLSTVAPADMAAQLAADAAGFFAVVQPALTHLRTAQGSVVAVTTAATARFPVRDGLSSAPKAAVEAMV
ncbi:MAG: SDR family NAD(P)-dependent oxidoreductase, partial [Actinomycetales bacterium]